MSTEVIRLENISYSYDKKRLALDDVSLSIKKGSKVVIVGHNGSGKSTIAKLVCGLLNFSYGNVYINNEKMTVKNVDTLRENIGIVFQNPDNQFVGATVRDDIAFGLENRRVPQKDMDYIIDMFAKQVNMFDFLDREPSNLSGGQKQRVAIASVLALSTNVIFLDEATTMLDPKGKKEINELIEEIKKENKYLTIISITHDIEEILKADQIIVLNQGKVFFDGDKQGFMKLDLKQIGLEDPFIYQIIKKLKEKNVNIDAFEERELIEKLCQLSLKK